jgi:hypothetical protein
MTISPLNGGFNQVLLNNYFLYIAIGEALVQALSFLAPFLTDDLIQSLPYTMALTLTTFPKELQNCIMEVLCNTLLPIASIEK